MTKEELSLLSEEEMTKEEKELTITYLTKMQEEYIEGEGYERHPLPEYYALDMAIKALEQNEKLKADNEMLAENCLKDLITCHSSIIKEQLLQVIKLNTSDDCVSREQAIKTITTDIQLKLEGRTGLLKYSDEIKDILKTLLDSQEKKLKALLSVTPTHGTCKDCKKCDFEESDRTYFCKPYGILVSPSHYCKEFENRGGEND